MTSRSQGVKESMIVLPQYYSLSIKQLDVMGEWGPGVESKMSKIA
jgi:hypothetical protein